jgi:hypothetical protein
MCFEISYAVRSPHNLKAADEVYVETLGDAVTSYLPDADLTIEVGDRVFPIVIDRDMYGLHEDLLDLSASMAAGASGYGPYLEAIPEDRSATNYSVRLTEAPHPTVLFFQIKDGTVAIQSRTLVGKSVEATAQDVIEPVEASRVRVLQEINNFLLKYMEDLASQIPVTATLAEYQEYRSRLAHSMELTNH